MDIVIHEHSSRLPALLESKDGDLNDFIAVKTVIDKSDCQSFIQAISPNP